MAGRREPGLALYHFDGCPFCRRVRDALFALDLEIEQHNIHENARRYHELIEATGRSTVPCLRIDGEGSSEWMHESADIVRYLREHFA